MTGANDLADLQPRTIATVVSVTILALLAVGLRVLARREKRSELWWDDYLILWSMIWNLVVVGFIFAMLNSGMGMHSENIDSTDIFLLSKYRIVVEGLYVFNIAWTKLSFLLFYYRIFHFHYFKIWAYIIGTVVVLWAVTTTFLFAFTCMPVDLPGQCISQVNTWVANGISTITTDLAVLILPLPQVWNLNLRLKQKLAVIGAFLLGVFVIFSSTYRFVLLFGYSALDPTYTLVPTVTWTSIGISIGIVLACLPTLVPAAQFFIRKLGLGRFLSKSDLSSSNGSRAFETIGRKNGNDIFMEPTSERPNKNVSVFEYVYLLKASEGHVLSPSIKDNALTKTTNLDAIEPLGHGTANTAAEHWMYRESALQTTSALNMEKALTLETSRGDWIVVYVVLRGPNIMSGCISLNTSTDYESMAESRVAVA